MAVVPVSVVVRAFTVRPACLGHPCHSTCSSLKEQTPNTSPFHISPAGLTCTALICTYLHRPTATFTTTSMSPILPTRTTLTVTYHNHIHPPQEPRSVSARFLLGFRSILKSCLAFY